jgi:hypothetical protein
MEVDERFYELMADLMVSRCVEGSTYVPLDHCICVKLTIRPGRSYRTFIYHQPKGEQTITLIEELAAIQAGTTGLRTWTAAYDTSFIQVY